MNSDEMIVTPWEVSGAIDYTKLIEQFGTEPLTNGILEQIRRISGDLHLHLRRKIFFSHRDFTWILNMYERGERFTLYTGRGPSGETHIGHIVPWIFTKYLQDRFNAKLYFQLTDDEKFLITPKLTSEKTYALALENALDVIAVGFDEKKTFLISDMKHAGLMYNVALKVSKHVTTSTAKAVFGFTDSSNIGIQFFPAVQAVPCFLESILRGKNVPCLIPAAIDQDPYWRIARDVAPKIGFFKPAQIHSRFLPGLGRGGKMSSSLPETCIFLTDTTEAAKKKVMDAFTGGRATVKEQKKLGGEPRICPIFQYETFLFETQDTILSRIEDDCRRGELLCGEHKITFATKVIKFLEEHQRRRNKARDKLSEFLLDPKELESRLLP